MKFQRRRAYSTGSPLNADTLGLRSAGPWHATRSADRGWSPLCGAKFDGQSGGIETRATPFGEACEECVALAGDEWPRTP
jgi:hypothetical protein